MTHFWEDVAFLSQLRADAGPPASTREGLNSEGRWDLKGTKRRHEKRIDNDLKLKWHWNYIEMTLNGFCFELPSSALQACRCARAPASVSSTPRTAPAAWGWAVVSTTPRGWRRPCSYGKREFWKTKSKFQMSRGSYIDINMSNCID